MPHMFPLNECRCRKCVKQFKPQIDIPETSKHHLFSRPEIREKLIQILGEPLTEKENKRLEKLVEEAWNSMPTYRISHDKHILIHKPAKLLRRVIDHPKK